MSKSLHIHRTPAQKRKLDAQLLKLVATGDRALKEIASELGITHYYTCVILNRLGYRRRWVSAPEWETVVSWRTDEKRMRS